MLAALLCWLDARSRNARFDLRLEDVDRERCTPESAADMRGALRWFGIDWDGECLQSERRGDHERALERLDAAGHLYPCSCSRRKIRKAGTRAVDGGFRYPGTCRKRALPLGGWRACGEALRLRLPEGRVSPVDEGGLVLAQVPEQDMGDPVLRRRDGSVAYHLAGVVDDGVTGVTRVVRGRDLAVSTATHVVLQRLLGIGTPSYRHHLLLLEERGGKLAKLHGAVGWRELRGNQTAEALCGFLAGAIGLADSHEPVAPRELIGDFDWRRVRTDDVVLRWTGRDLVEIGDGSRS